METTGQPNKQLESLRPLYVRAAGIAAISLAVGGGLIVQERQLRPAETAISGSVNNDVFGPPLLLGRHANELQTHRVKKEHETYPVRPEFMYVPAPKVRETFVQKPSAHAEPDPVVVDLSPSGLTTLKARSFVRIGRPAYAGLPEAPTRSTIARVMDSEFDRNVHEVPAGSNRGPRVDYYIRQDLNHWKRSMREWCAGFDSTVYMEADVPLDGGFLYGKHNPGYLLLRAGKALNPHENPHVMSVMDWFEANSYFYLNSGHTPKTGDAVFMHYFDKDGLEQWHTGLVRNVTADGTLVTYEGNVSDALQKRYYPNYQQDSYIYGFGSFFAEK